MLVSSANTWLCRMTLQRAGIHAASLIVLRLAADVTVPALSVGSRRRTLERAGSCASAATRVDGRAGRPGAAGVAGAVCYTVLRQLCATSAATVQLSVLGIAALGGVLGLDKPLSTRLVLAPAAVLGGTRRCRCRDACKNTPQACDRCRMSTKQ